MLIPTIQTERLSLRPLLPEDAPRLYDIYQGEGVLRYFPNPSPPPLEKVQRFIQHQQDHWEQYGFGNWGIAPAGEREIIGWVGLQVVPELNETEVGFLLGRSWWGKGYATQAALASVQFGFEQCALDHLIALVHPDNLASRRVIEKCGLAYLETIALWGMQLMRHRIDREEAARSAAG